MCNDHFDYWDSNAARVVCRQLGYDVNTGGGELVTQIFFVLPHSLLHKFFTQNTIVNALYLAHIPLPIAKQQASQMPHQDETTASVRALVCPSS